MRNELCCKVSDLFFIIKIFNNYIAIKFDNAL